MNKQVVGYDNWFNETRQLVATALERSIQWDAFGIVRAHVAGTGAAKPARFRMTSATA
jgi:hypothetical protein